MKSIVVRRNRQKCVRHATGNYLRQVRKDSLFHVRIKKCLISRWLRYENVSDQGTEQSCNLSHDMHTVELCLRYLCRACVIWRGLTRGSIFVWYTDVNNYCFKLASSISIEAFELENVKRFNPNNIGFRKNINQM